MKRIHILAVVISVAIEVLGQTNFYEQVTQLWLDGEKTAVRDIGLQRLLADTNDVAGLILKLEYEVAFLDCSNMIQTATYLLHRGETILTPNFARFYREYQVNYQIMQMVLPNYSPEELEADRAKANIQGKRMTFGHLLQALHDDGYFQ